MDEKWDLGDGPYMAMIRRHKPLWDFIDRYTSTLETQSILDVGGGCWYASRYAPTYTLYDLNKGIIEEAKQGLLDAIHGDFTKADEKQFHGKYDTILMLGVVEHQGDINQMLSKALACKPRNIVVSFFRGLDRLDDRIETRNKDWGDKHTYRIKCFARNTINKTLLNHGIMSRSHLFKLRDHKGYPRRTVYDDVLVIDLSDDGKISGLISKMRRNRIIE